MKLIKKNSYPLEKCYAITSLSYEGRDHIVVAAEKIDRCLLFDLEGNLESTIWEKPGGTMSLVQVPLSNGVFLASQKMYSPNDSADAEIVLVAPDKTVGWSVRSLMKIPFVHRFDILQRGSKQYLLASTIKSGHQYKDDWSSPGQVIVFDLPGDTALWSNLEGTVIVEGLLKNHGYIRQQDAKGDYAVVSCENGVFAIYPPLEGEREWTVEQLVSQPVSDIAFVDFDGDGEKEMLVLSPFHGDTISLFKKKDEVYEMEYKYPRPAEFAHALWAGFLFGKPYAVVGHRKGESRDLLGICYEEGEYRVEVLAKDVGSTNVLRYTREGKECLVSTNREINEIAFYEFEA
ncbi:hypothetical protein [uncultured Sphaerochaeta sp.]|uniref:hypothetical protein n=1 Tax=uncultured Sphaerochaeta sp. TaxID=886478 RepID=UPI002A0A2374|nr:hypothetical protein [uncultured Sphaerochaeta sp.]